VELAFARAEVALNAAVIEAVPPPAGNNSIHLVMAYSHTLPFALS
jgi:hypothetical protein